MNQQCDRVKVTGNKVTNNFYIKKVSKVCYSDDIYINYCNVLFPKMVKKRIVLSSTDLLQLKSKHVSVLFYFQSNCKYFL